MISVIIPSYNSKGTITRAIESVYSQTYKDYEIIVVDDASNDGTWDLLKEKYGSEANVTLKRLETNSGAGIARKVALSIAKGRYYAFLDADDEWLPKKLAIQIEAARKYNAGIVHSSYYIVQSNKKHSTIITPKKFILISDLYWKNPIATSSALVSCSLDGVLDMPNIRTRQDYAYWWSLICKNKTPVVGLSEPLMKYHITYNSLSSSMIKNLLNNYQMFRKSLGFSIFSSLFFVSLNALSRIGKFLKVFVSNLKTINSKQ
jgi:glycosyltransferase involved in cell wall biosynthesis